MGREWDRSWWSCLGFTVWSTAAGPRWMVGKCLPSSGENLIYLVGLVTTFQSDTTDGFAWCHRYGTLVAECFLCQLVFAVSWVTAGLLPYPADWDFNLLCLNFLVGMSWNCTEQHLCETRVFLFLWMLCFSFWSCKTRVSSGYKPQQILDAQCHPWINCQILFWGRLIKAKTSLE